MTTTTTFTTTTNNNSIITNNSRLHRSAPQLSLLTFVHKFHNCIVATRDIILNITLQRCKGLTQASRRGRRGGRASPVPIVKQVQSIILQLCLLSKIHVIILAASALPLFPTSYLLKRHYCYPSCFLSPSASWRFFLLPL